MPSVSRMMKAVMAHRVRLILSCFVGSDRHGWSEEGEDGEVRGTWMSESEIESRSKFDPPAPAFDTCLPSGKANPAGTVDPSQLVVYPLRLCDDGIDGH